jgi:hypothetical protein
MTPVLRSLVLLALAACAACGSDTPTSPSDDATPITETFSSIVQPKGATSRSFTTSASGAITLSLTALGHDTAAVGLALGLADATSGQCSPTYAVVTTQYSARQLSATADAGRYCFVVYDVGELTGQTTFTVTVVHP